MYFEVCIVSKFNEVLLLELPIPDLLLLQLLAFYDSFDFFCIQVVVVEQALCKFSQLPFFQCEQLLHSLKRFLYIKLSTLICPYI